jgi:hypothetical protein
MSIITSIMKHSFVLDLFRNINILKHNDVQTMDL